MVPREMFEKEYLGPANLGPMLHLQELRVKGTGLIFEIFIFSSSGSKELNSSGIRFGPL